ncbi:MAG: hypothetical protein MUO63_12990 [Desulfobulbaceae bacterium]|nr:hypothetical protein [Desulfobulbaceae bacterium]
MEWLKAIIRNVSVGIGIVRKPAFIVDFLEKHPVPENIQAGVVYIIRSDGYPKWAIFRCPKHEEEIIQLSLMEKRRPCWTVKRDWLGRPTINPSVRQLEGSCAHFWVKTGHVEWCADSGRQPRNIGDV